MFASIGRFIYKRRWAVLLAGLASIVLSGIYGTGVFPQLKGGGFNDPNAESTKVIESLHQDLGRDEGALIVLFTSNDGSTVDSPSYKQAVEATLAKVEGRSNVGRVTSFYSSGAPQLVSNDRHSTYAIVGLAGEQEAQKDAMKELRLLLTSDTLQVRLGGQPAITEEINKQVTQDLARAETTTFPILALLLVLIFGSLVAASLPLALGGMVILGAFLVLRIASNFTDISVFSINVITMLGLGLAIDYSLFMVSRFREELARQGGDISKSLAITMQTAGRTVVFSGLTVMISLLSLTVFPQMFLKSIGLGGAAAVLVAMLATLTILPAALALLGPRVNSLSLLSFLRRNRRGNAQQAQVQLRLQADAGHGFWYNTSRFVMRHPMSVLIVTLLPLLIVGLPFLRVNLSVPDARTLPPSQESRVVSELLSSEFLRNETQPIQIVVHTEGSAIDAGNLDALYDYTREIEALPGVRRVDSLVNLDPRLDKAGYAAFYAKAQNPQAVGAAAQFSNGDYSLVSVLYDSDPLSRESQDLVRNIRAISLAAGMTTQVGGSPAQLVDFLAGLQSSLPWALGLIILVVFILLFLMLGSLVIPFKAVVLNILSLSVSFGSLVWIFQDGNLANVLGFTPLGSIDGTQPVLIFAIAFGLAMDYEVFLLSRIKEQYDRTGDTTASVATGVQKTAAIITSAALLLVIVVAGFATGEIVVMKQVGIGLALAVLVDATLVRMLLVPSTMRLMGRYNWWAPTPLKRLYNRLGLAEPEPAGQTERESPRPAPSTTPALIPVRMDDHDA
jgi:RND superfamily putative drug exporter